jgi:hypothetical protein
MGDRCCYCGGPVQDNYSIHRDGFDEGPEIELCDACAEDDAITCEMIWARTRVRSAAPQLRLILGGLHGQG